MVSVERIKQFTKIPSEAEWKIKDCLPSPNWPTKGDVDLRNLQVTHLSPIGVLGSFFYISEQYRLFFFFCYILSSLYFRSASFFFSMLMFEKCWWFSLFCGF